MAFMQLDGVSAKTLHQALLKAPWGYHMDGHNAAHVRDWRSWEAFYGKKYSLASILLMQRFPTKLYASAPSAC
jgi:hypothetical protein